MLNQVRKIFSVVLLVLVAIVSLSFIHVHVILNVQVKMLLRQVSFFN